MTDLEKKIIHLISQEMTNKEIAYKLNYSQRMVEYKVSLISQKMDVKTRVGIIAKAFKFKIIKTF